MIAQADQLIALVNLLKAMTSTGLEKARTAEEPTHDQSHDDNTPPAPRSSEHPSAAATA